QRRRVLRGFAVYEGKWLLSGVVVSSLIVLGEIWEVGPEASWSRFGRWWFLTPMLVGLIPVAFFLFILAIESVVFVMFGLFSLPGLVFKDEDQWSRISRRVGFLACLGFAAWMLWGIGRGLATDTLVRQSTSVPAPPSVASPATAEHIAWIALLRAQVTVWIQAHAVLCAVAALLAGNVLKPFTDTVLKEAATELYPRIRGRAGKVLGALRKFLDRDDP
ncbi:MAG TPA: hypothetical protein VG368_04780, partial [Acidimicrobiales bacterium]|nr:hypothetical protein [Acidimicrobiales bacterium]